MNEKNGKQLVRLMPDQVLASMVFFYLEASFGCSPKATGAQLKPGQVLPPGRGSSHSNSRYSGSNWLSHSIELPGPG